MSLPRRLDLSGCQPREEVSRLYFFSLKEAREPLAEVIPVYGEEGMIVGIGKEEEQVVVTTVGEVRGTMIYGLEDGTMVVEEGRYETGKLWFGLVSRSAVGVGMLKIRG